MTAKKSKAGVSYFSFSDYLIDIYNIISNWLLV